jgi:hypothetical protein
MSHSENDKSESARLSLLGTYSTVFSYLEVVEEALGERGVRVQVHQVRSFLNYTKGSTSIVPLMSVTGVWSSNRLQIKICRFVTYTA